MVKAQEELLYPVSAMLKFNVMFKVSCKKKFYFWKQVQVTVQLYLRIISNVGNSDLEISFHNLYNLVYTMLVFLESIHRNIA